MDNVSSRASRFDARFRARAVIAMIAAGGAMVAGAHAPADPAAVQEGHPTGHLHDHADMVWPPQPRGMRDVLLRSDAAAQARDADARKRGEDSEDRRAKQRADVREALGVKYTRAALINETDKSGASRVSRLVYFSYSNNETVEVELDGQQVRGLKRTPAAEYQPEITDEESAEAESVARAHFNALGEARVAQLQAFSILAYQPSGKGFYGARVIYVSFHADSDSPPEFMAWVDLTHEKVLRTRKEQP